MGAGKVWGLAVDLPALLMVLVVLSELLLVFYLEKWLFSDWSRR